MVLNETGTIMHMKILIFFSRLLKSVTREVLGIIQIIRCIFRHKNELIFRSWISLKKGVVEHRNWGDDINKFFFEKITEKKVLIYPTTRIARLIPLPNYAFIGSIVPHLLNKNSIVWGSGVAMPTVINNNQKFIIPKRILAVRGPLTRQYFQDKGIACPNVLGDPALLLPLFYKPQIKNKYKIGIIPHFDDLRDNNHIVKKILANKDVCLIRTGLYNDWHDFIDEINSCELVISASLHGIIVSEAYCIPSVWVEFSSHEPLWDYRFHDFYKSIAKNHEEKKSLDKSSILNDLLKFKTLWKPGEFFYKPLLEACPFYEDMKKHIICTSPEDMYPIFKVL